MDPAEVLADVLDVARSAVELVEQTNTQFGNVSYVLRHGAECFVVRFGASAERLPGADRHAELAVLRAVAPWSLGPEVVHCEPHRELLVTRYVAGRVWSDAELRERAQLLRLGERFAVLHRIPPPVGVRTLALPSYIEALEQRAAHVPDRLQDGARRLLDELEAVSPAVCHNDVHAGNLVDDGVLRLLDWEYAAFGDPDFDLAAPISYHQLGAAEQRALLEGYEAEGRRVDRRRLSLAVWLFEYVTCLWQVAVFGHEDAGRAGLVASMKQPVVARFDELARRLKQ